MKTALESFCQKRGSVCRGSSSQSATQSWPLPRPRDFAVSSATVSPCWQGGQGSCRSRGRDAKAHPLGRSSIEQRRRCGRRWRSAPLVEACRYCRRQTSLLHCPGVRRLGFGRSALFWSADEVRPANPDAWARAEGGILFADCAARSSPGLGVSRGRRTGRHARVPRITPACQRGHAHPGCARRRQPRRARDPVRRHAPRKASVQCD